MTGRFFLLGAGPEFFARLTCGVEFRALTSSVWRLLQDGDSLAGAANCLEIVPLVDPTPLRCGGV